MKRWADVQKALFSQKEQNETDTYLELIIGIHERRKELGLTQRELADRVELKQPAIARLENGKNSSRIDTLLRVIDALDLKIKLIPKE